jgi:hypothetical protein
VGTGSREHVLAAMRVVWPDGFARRERRHMQVWRQPRAETIILVIGGE